MRRRSAGQRIDALRLAGQVRTQNYAIFSPKVISALSSHQNSQAEEAVVDWHCRHGLATPLRSGREVDRAFEKGVYGAAVLGDRGDFGVAHKGEGRLSEAEAGAGFFQDDAVGDAT